ncbi:MAG: sigma-70 family RNA polymerase sigma factor [Clostridia bacterium]|nr:sigma-70 family RNA polymerase sigma factor [Clostridia bacterium]
MSLFSKGRDAQRFEALAERSEKKVYLTCLRMMRSHEDAQDALQETMLRAYKAFSSFRGDAQFSTWIDRIAVHTCLDLLKKKKAVLSLDMLRDDGFDAPDQQESVYARLDSKERLRLLKEGISLLPDDMRTVLVMRELELRSMEEIAALLSLPEGTVKSRLSRARKKLCRYLSQHAELFDNFSV